MFNNSAEIWNQEQRFGKHNWVPENRTLYSSKMWKFWKRKVEKITEIGSSTIIIRVLVFIRDGFSSAKKMKSPEFGNVVVPDDVIFQILLRLPLKSLFRCKAVCKLWGKLISNKHFTQRYNDGSLTNPIVLFRQPNLVSASSLSHVRMDQDSFLSLL